MYFTNSEILPKFVDGLFRVFVNGYTDPNAEFYVDYLVSKTRKRFQIGV